MTWRLPTATDLLKIVIVKNATRSPKTLTDGKVVFTGKAAKATVRQLGGTSRLLPRVRRRQGRQRLRHRRRADQAARLQAVPRERQRAARHGAPDAGRSRSGRRYYNVQLYLGSKRVTQSWPKSASFKIPRSKLKKGKTYTWYVWPGVGKKSAGRYGT